MSEWILGWNVVRSATNKALEMAEAGIISWETLATCALKFMSDNEVEEMLRCNDLYPEEDEEDED